MRRRGKPDPEVGDRFGKLVVIDNRRDPETGRKILCRCDCGTEKYVRVYNLQNGRATSCDCWRSERLLGTKFPTLDLPNDPVVTTGSRHHRWTALAEPRTGHNRVVHCRCDCGTEKDVAVEHLLSGESTSCGCWRRDAARAVHEQVAR